jgi:diguanylate cyclase (GGDEF)-like protein
MSLHKKIILYVGLTTFILLSILYLISERSLTSNYESLEFDYSKEGLKRVLLSFFDEYKNLGAITINYAGWDDTYNFVERKNIPDGNDPYITVNYADSLFESSRLNFALLFNNRKQVYLGKSYDFVRKERVDGSGLINDLLKKHASFIEHPDASSRKQGIIVVGGKPIIAASYPILTSNNEGPVHGSLVFARWVDDNYIRYVSEKADTALSYKVVDAAFTLPANASTIVSGSQELPFWMEADASVIHSFALIKDIDGHPALLLEYTMPRDFYRQAQDSIRFYLLYFALSGLAFFAIVSFVLQRTLFRRLNRAISGMKRIEKKQDVSLRIAEDGNDELAEMERSFNRMMASLEAAQKEIVYQANHDVLTGLPNRKAFFAILEKQIDRCRVSQERFAVMFVDLDRFKLVNDTLGHHIGDLLLIEVAARIRRHLGKGDFLCRLGGDEFCIISSFGRNDWHIDRLVTGLQQALDAPFELEGQYASISASIGISKYPHDGPDCEHLLQHSDAAMLAVKEAGKAHYRWYNESIDAQRKRRLLMESLLGKAIDNNELHLHYQPKLDLRSNEAIGVEALLRWNSPQLGNVSPSEFIPVAEASGVINEIGDWIMRTAFRQFKEWQADDAKGNSLGVAINISGAQLLQPNFVERVRLIFEEEQVKPGHFEFEVTESFAITNFDEVIDVLTELRRMGFMISIDDFGAGYSSLKYLCELPIQVVKIDKSLIDQLNANARSRVIVSTIIDMAHRLQLTVVAEGVENAEQMSFLREHDCDRVQGYLVCKPVPADRVTDVFGALCVKEQSK